MAADLKDMIELLVERLTSQIKLYHYSMSDAPALVLDPKRFAQNSFTKRDMAASSVPRVFFYMNPGDKEDFFQDPRYSVYSVSVKEGSIYPLSTDPLGLRKKFIDIDEILREVISLNFKGIMYNTGGRTIVNWFEPIKVTKEKG